jgi:pyrimidine-nucleoside phosphorylase
MSKKLAAGGDVILLDVKYGSGAFMKTPADAERLARCMVEIGKRAGKKCGAAVTSMQQPLTGSVGCNREVKSAIRALRGERSDLYELSASLAARILLLAGMAASYAGGIRLFEETTASGAALKSFEKIIVCQGGDPEVLYAPEKFLPDAPYTFIVQSGVSGYVTAIDTANVGRAAGLLGAGRAALGDEIDHAAGLEFRLRLNNRVEEGDTVAELYAGDPRKFTAAEAMLKNCYTVSDKKTATEPLLYSYIG